MVTEHTYQIIVMPEGGSTGQNLVKVLNCLDLRSRLPVVIVADVECNGNRSWVQQPPFSSSTQEVLDYAGAVGQFDWATFFFFHEPLATPVEQEPYDNLFATAELVIRAVDDTYFYVYSPNAADASRLGQIFRVESQKKAKATVIHPF